MPRAPQTEVTTGAKGQMIKAFDEGIALMKVGGKATLVVPSSLAYGDSGSGSIPAYTTLVFDVELMDVQDVKPVQVKN